VLFAGDSAHQVSPFGARGANSGLEDAENLAWKLARVLKGTSPEALLESYHIERSFAADENIRESTRSTDFMAPTTKQEARLRQAVLSLAKDTEFGKRMINGGRLSVPSRYETPLSTPDADAWSGGPVPGASMPDAPLKTREGGDRFLTEAFTALGKDFTLMQFANGGAAVLPDAMKEIRIGEGGFNDDAGTARARYDARPGTAYLLRPDGYVAARFRAPTRASVEAAMNRACAIS
jgi:3-(3-hydroxy-phenyl)propionate hydroxylase